jgi:hypothetical protein
VLFRDWESVMDAESTKAIQYAEKLMSAAIDVVGAAKIELNQDWARDPKIVGLTILCRSVSNFSAAMLLVQQRHVMEARALGRCLYENLLWMGALRERGLDFVQDMRKDEAFNRQSLGELTLRLSKKHGADVSSPDSLTLRSIIKDIGNELSRRSGAIYENGMQFCHHDRSFADCRAHPLDRSRAHIADGEHAMNARFQGQRTARSIV